MNVKIFALNNRGKPAKWHWSYLHCYTHTIRLSALLCTWQKRSVNLLFATITSNSFSWSGLSSRLLIWCASCVLFARGELMQLLDRPGTVKSVKHEKRSRFTGAFVERCLHNKLVFWTIRFNGIWMNLSVFASTYWSISFVQTDYFIWQLINWCTFSCHCQLVLYHFSKLLFED